MIALKLEVHVDELAAKANKLQLGSTVVIIVAKTPDPSLTTSSDEAPEISSLKKVAESAKTVVHVTHEDDDDNIEKILPPAPKQRRPRHSAPAASSPIFEQVIKPPTRARHSDVGTNLICCSAKNITKPYNQCGNKIKFDYSLFGIVDPLCHRHSKLEDPRQGSFMAPFVDTGVEQPVDFSAWIPDDVCRPIQRALRKKIQQTQSHGEQPGYIYAYEIRDPNSNMFTIKVGRSEGNVVERLVAWKKSCPSKEIVLRGWWPGIDSNDCDQETVITLDDPLLSIHQRVLSSRKAKRCHQLEALIHLELRGREKHGQQTETKVNVQATLCKQRAGSEPPRSPSETTCSDFLASHREIFQFERFTLDEDIGKEWERIVQPVIEKWEMFLSAYAPNGGIY